MSCLGGQRHILRKGVRADINSIDIYIFISEVLRASEIVPCAITKGSRTSQVLVTAIGICTKSDFITKRQKTILPSSVIVSLADNRIAVCRTRLVNPGFNSYRVPGD